MRTLRLSEDFVQKLVIWNIDVRPGVGFEMAVCVLIDLIAEEIRRAVVEEMSRLDAARNEETEIRLREERRRQLKRVMARSAN